MITEKSNRLQVIVITDYDYPISAYMSAHVLLNLLKELRKGDKMRGLPGILSLFHELINSIIQEHEC